MYLAKSYSIIIKFKIMNTSSSNSDESSLEDYSTQSISSSSCGDKETIYEWDREMKHYDKLH